MKSKLYNMISILDDFAIIQNSIKFWKLASLISLSKNYQDTSFKKKIDELSGQVINNVDFEYWISYNHLEYLSQTKWTLIRNKSLAIASLNGKNYFISTNPINESDELFDKIKLSSANLIPSYNKIPKLFLYEGKNINQSQLVKLDKNLSNYSFIAESIITLFKLSLNEKTTDSINNFIQENNSKIQEIINMGTSLPRPVGCGTDGCAYSISNNLILKLFKNSNLYNSYLESIHRLYKDPNFGNTEAMIYDVGELGKFRYAGLNIPLYYVILEKMVPVLNLGENFSLTIESIIKSIVNLFYENKDILKEIKNELSNKESDSSKIKEEINIFKNTFAREVRKIHNKDITNIEKSVDLSPDWLESLVEEILVKYLTSRTDLHIGNLGISKYKKLRYFDAYHDQHKSDIVYFNNQNSNNVTKTS